MTPVQIKAAALAKELSGKTFILVGDGGLDNKTLGLTPGISYRYLVGCGPTGWRGWNTPDGEYATIVINQAKDVGAIPMFTYYQLALEFEQKNYGVLTSDKLHQYLLDIRLMFQKLGTYGNYSLVHLEPDFFGYLQQYAITINTPASNIPAKIHYSDLPECASFPETIGGMLSSIIKMARTLAPKCRIGFHASMWGDWYDNTDIKSQVAIKAASVGNFLRSVGSDQTDFVVIETSDRDAGFYESQGQTKIYWDETNSALPNFSTHFSWAKTLADTMIKPLLWWQTPFGVQSAINGGTDGHYRDNRSHYLFAHMSDVVSSGGFGVLFGAGADNQTTPITDNGAFKLALINYQSAPQNISPITPA